MVEDLGARLRASLGDQERVLRLSLILNPVENIPFAEDLSVAAGPLHGLYNTDKPRSRAQRIGSDHQFAGRQAVENDCRVIYDAWASALQAADATLRLLSGLHTHIVLFMAMARPGDRVLLLPVEAGGHLSGRAIVERLGLEVVEMVVDEADMRVDIDNTLERYGDTPLDFIFVDRSEGLVFEDFKPLADIAGPHKIFDASQYLTNIVCGHYPNPFAWGFDLMIGSVHKNFPGPQKALLATRHDDEIWRKILGGVSTFVSNMHFTSTYAAGLTLARSGWLKAYSRRMLSVAVSLEEELFMREVPVVRRRKDKPPTHHLWIREASRERAFETYEALEGCSILTNFRKLPYSLGHGLRLGVSAAVRLGLTEDDTPALAELITEARRYGPTSAIRKKAQSFSEEIWLRGEGVWGLTPTA